MSNVEDRALVPVQYVGKKREKVDNVAGTGLAWTPGQIHYVPPLMAQKLARHPDVWKVVDDATVDADPGRVGLVVTEPDTQTPASTAKEPEGKKELEQPPQTFDLPNLQGMTRPDIADFVSRNFNTTLPANMKKEDMIAQAVNLANSRAAGEIQ